MVNDWWPPVGERPLAPLGAKRAGLFFQVPRRSGRLTEPLSARALEHSSRFDCGLPSGKLHPPTRRGLLILQSCWSLVWVAGLRPRNSPAPSSQLVRSLWIRTSKRSSIRAVPECRDAILTRESEDALWQSFFTAEQAHRSPLRASLTTSSRSPNSPGSKAAISLSL
jgi:hypothetical protein